MGSLWAKLNEWFPRSPDWPTRLYAFAVVELDHKLLIERVEATEAAIHGRLRDLQCDSDHHEERQLIADAQHTLAARGASPGLGSKWQRPAEKEC
jgi:hypothetical protein